MFIPTSTFNRYKLLSIILFSFSFAGLKIISQDKLTGVKEELQLYENTYSLIIGIDNYPNLSFNQQLQYAVSDAKAVAESIGDNFIFSEITTLYNDQAGKYNVQQAISNFRKTGKEDGVFIFFAGHGYTESTQDGDLGYIIPHDGSMNEIEMFKNISMNELKDLLKPIKAKHVFLVVDACYSGTLLATGLITGQAGLALDNWTIADTSGNLAINTNKFTIAGATGNTAIAGTLEVTGNCGFYGESAVAQYATEGTTTGFTAGSGTAAKDDSTFTGNTGTKAYTVGDIVLALKGLGLIDS